MDRTFPRCRPGPLVGLAILAWASVVGTGCRTGPRSFQELTDPSAFRRARAVGLGEEVPESVAVPALIDRLRDPDAVVRLTAHEALKKRTGQDFGFVPYRDPQEQDTALDGWKTWWDTRRTQLVENTDQAPAQTRRARRNTTVAR